MGKIAFLFPGQGSQSVGMGKSFAKENVKVKEIFAEANEILQMDLSSIIFNGPEEKLTLTKNAQPALVTMSIALLASLAEHDIKPDYVAGHSLGEYSALIAAGALTFSDGLYAVRKRGIYMEEAVPASTGTMSAVLGLAEDDLKRITAEITNSGHLVQLANINCPGQIVISGTIEGINLATERAKERGARRVIPLQVSGPFHSKLMEPASERFTSILNKIEIRNAVVPIIANVTAQPIKLASEIKASLIKQIYSPVLWEKSIRRMINDGVNTFIEIGNGKILSGLVRKIDRSVKVLSIQDEQSYQKTVALLQGVK